MSTCKHTTWLRLCKSDCQIAVEASNRPHQILEDVKCVDEPAGTVLLVGNQTKAVALSSFGIGPSFLTPRSSHAEYHLHVSRLHPVKPVIICEGNLPCHNRLPQPRKQHDCHERKIKPFIQDSSTAGAINAADEVCRRVFSPFADVICVFVSDVGGIESTVLRLAAWATRSPPSTSPIRPALVLVVPRNQRRRLRRAVQGTLDRSGQKPLSEFFQHVSIVPATSIKWSRRRRQEPLRQQLVRSIDLVHRERLKRGWLFSARHTVELLQAALDNAVSSSYMEFDFIKTSRREFPVLPELAGHLMNFLTSFHNADSLKSIAIPLIASSFILDQYPPNMHAFPPEKVFHALYRVICVEVGQGLKARRENINLPVLPFDLVQLIENEVISQYNQYIGMGTSKSLRRRHLEEVRSQFVFPSCEETCFSCLQRKPQYRLACGHWTCQICIRIFHSPDEGDPWLFHVKHCVLCGLDTGRLQIRVKPDTATARVLSIDGGGIRGIAPLEFLGALQDAVALPYPVQRHFDVVFGTSSGAMIACALFYNNWTVEECIRYFETSSKSAFEKRHLIQLLATVFGDLPIIPSIIQCLFSLWVDSKYSAKKLEIIQKDAYGHNRGIEDSKEANKMGALVGVTLTSTEDASTFIATNYNGIGERNENSDYHILKSSQGANSVPLWEILRCCTAAPYYFTPHDIEGVGKFQDGGLTYNNPAAIALEETAVLFPSNPEPSIVVSLGTGSSRHCSHKKEKGSAWDDSFAARLFRAFWKQGDSDVAWRQLLGYQKPGGGPDFFRFDIDFQTKPPALDDTDGMNEVGRMAREAAHQSPGMGPLAKRIRAELFIFELDLAQPPRFVAGAYECVGFIFCRLRTGSTEYTAFMHQLLRGTASLICQDQKLPMNFDAQPHIENDTGTFQQTVKFHVHSRQHQISISLQEGSSSCHISGSPFTLDHLIEQQNMEACFGTADHRKRAAEDTTVEVPMLQHKRRRLC